MAAIKNKLSGSFREGLLLRRGLIVLQLMISQALVICSIIIVQQLRFFNKMPLGLQSSAVVEVPLPNRKTVDLSQLKERLETLSGVQSVNMSNTGSASVDSWGGDFEATLHGQLVKDHTNVKIADEDYLKTYGLTLLAGNDLLKSDTVNGFVVNEHLSGRLGCPILTKRLACR